ncbi:MAG: tRNA 2-thiocytidine biosynthesis TtcA family protein [Eubacteriales bacterium]|nr:tRNA 2-thiocytidine biosynthesis TtcA family protein [Eubacteriales bacterium]
MKRILGALRRADQRFRLINPGDRIMIGVSGGKDSLVLLKALSLYRKFSKCEYELHAVMLGMGLEKIDISPLEAFCAQADVPFTFQETNIGQIVFYDRKESNPCSLCAKMRRGILLDAAKAHGCNKLALGHHRDDAIETLLMSILYEGRMRTFSPVTWLDRSDMVQIRPLIFAEEAHIAQVAQVIGAPITKNPCPAAGTTTRQDMKDLIVHLKTLQPRADQYLMHALEAVDSYGLWNDIKYRPGEAPGENEGK